MLTDSQVIEEWRRRRSTTWRAIRIALAVLCICGLAFWYLARTPAYDQSAFQLIASFIVFGALSAAALVVIFRTNKLYRCPRCNEVPGYDGWPLHPETCARCNAVLRDTR
jgi:hypothetical protein